MHFKKKLKWTNLTNKKKQNIFKIILYFASAPCKRKNDLSWTIYNKNECTCDT